MSLAQTPVTFGVILLENLSDKVNLTMQIMLKIRAFLWVTP